MVARAKKELKAKIILNMNINAEEMFWGNLLDSLVI
jgi:hypothetical protein